MRSENGIFALVTVIRVQHWQQILGFSGSIFEIKEADKKL